jgi:hypothetical protein
MSITQTFSLRDLDEESSKVAAGQEEGDLTEFTFQQLRASSVC